jgi:hypothetical protein
MRDFLRSPTANTTMSTASKLWLIGSSTSKFVQIKPRCSLNSTSPSWSTKSISRSSRRRNNRKTTRCKSSSVHQMAPKLLLCLTYATSIKWTSRSLVASEIQSRTPTTKWSLKWAQSMVSRSLLTIRRRTGRIHSTTNLRMKCQIFQRCWSSRTKKSDSAWQSPHVNTIAVCLSTTLMSSSASLNFRRWVASLKTVCSLTTKPSG